MAENIISVENLGKEISLEKKIIGEIESFMSHLKNSGSGKERRMIESQLNPLIENLKKASNNVLNHVEEVSLTKSLSQNSGNENNVSEDVKTLSKNTPQFQPLQQNSIQTGQNNLNKKEDNSLTDMEQLSVTRLKNKEEKVVKKKKKRPSGFVKVSSKYFYKLSSSFIKKNMFEDLRRNLIKGNIDFVPAAYISMIFFSTLLSLITSIFLVAFFSFFTITFSPPFIIGVDESFGGRFLKFFWILFAVPLITFLITYSYPSLERKSLERKIETELPFATIHMSAISNSMIEPSKIFGILVSTGEYPFLSKELIKLQNEINIYGYDLVTALRNRAFNSPSRKLAELFNGLATTITSGGNLPVFFDKRSQSLLFEYRLEMEKQGKAAETFMDIYISVVIAAPMVLMLLLMMMSISGLGIALSPGTISLIMILSVTLINIMFLAFLQLRQPESK
ncbi:MAG: type II secretion system F family protein [Candidatus Pacearchaeota archaeon]